WLSLRLFRCRSSRVGRLVIRPIPRQLFTAKNREARRKLSAECFRPAKRARQDDGDQFDPGPGTRQMVQYLACRGARRDQCRDRSCPFLELIPAVIGPATYGIPNPGRLCCFRGRTGFPALAQKPIELTDTCRN